MRMGRAGLLAAVLLVFFGTLTAAGAMDLETWLVTDPAAVPRVSDRENPGEQALHLEELFSDPAALWPEEGMALVLGPHAQVLFEMGSPSWELPAPGGAASVALAATYLRTPRWQEGTLFVTHGPAFIAYLDGELLHHREQSSADADPLELPVTLTQGHHRLLIASAVLPGDTLGSWTLHVRYEPADTTLTDEERPTTQRSPVHPFTMDDAMLRGSVHKLLVSPDGRYGAVHYGPWGWGVETPPSTLDLYDLKRGERTARLNRDGLGAPIAFSPDSERLLLRVKGSHGSDLAAWNTLDGSVEVLARGFEQASAFQWAPDGGGVYYARRYPHKAADEQPYKLMQGVEDRWDDWRDRIEIRYRDFGSGADVAVALVAENVNADFPTAYGITADGRTLYFRRAVAVDQRPFMALEFWRVDLATGESERLASERFQWSLDFAVHPEGTHLAFTAPRHPVTGDENANPEHNSNDLDLWLLEVASGELMNVDPDFQPAVGTGYYGTGGRNGFVWRSDGELVFTSAYDKEILLCRYRPGDDAIRTEPLPSPGASQLAIPQEGGARHTLYLAEWAESPGSVWRLDLRNGRGEELLDPYARQRRLTTSAPRVEDYDVTYYDEQAGMEVTVPGYLYYPLGYSEEGSYPLIVDTYGGVIGFGDGWLWNPQSYANLGYFVYVPVPRGAAGYGSAYADTHPNDWGVKTSRDMNTGVRRIVANVPGVDGERVGFVSGSYGGFLAMYLLAMPEDHPDYYPYATAISDYGISNLASYFGVGWWGVQYMDMAAAGTYPWSDPQWYIDHSPLFGADRVTAPLLLVHGEGDNNVPVGESDQMYTALKVLDRDVVFVQFPGEDHGVASTSEKYLTSKRMHLEWFDKHLRGRGGAWEKRMADQFGK